MVIRSAHVPNRFAAGLQDARLVTRHIDDGLNDGTTGVAGDCRPEEGSAQQTPKKTRRNWRVEGSDRSGGVCARVIKDSEQNGRGKEASCPGGHTDTQLGMDISVQIPKLSPNSPQTQ